MEKLTTWLNTFMADFDFAKLLPELEGTLESIGGWIRVCFFIGPALLLLMGMWYYFIPPKEANRHVGFTAFFGMGSVKAWQFTQKLAGAVWGILGLILMIVMAVVNANADGMDIMELATSAVRYLGIQFIVIAICYVLLQLAIALLFNYHGDRRWQKAE